MADITLTIGQVTAPWGNKGEVKVFVLTDFPDRFSQLEKVVWVRSGKRKDLTIERTRSHKGLVLVKFSGVDDINAANELREGYLYITDEDTIKLPEGHYYFHEIIGMSVFTPSGEKIGVIREVLKTGSNDVYVVQRDQEQADLLLPALKSVIISIDPESKRMEAVVPEGLD